MIAERTAILGLEIYNVKKVSTDKGDLFHVVRKDHPFFEKFGEVYVSSTKPGVIKGWKLHTCLVQHFTVPVGAVKFVFFDARSDSASKGHIFEASIGAENYRLLKVPAGVWYSFQTISAETSYIVNCTTEVHSPAESQSLPLETPEIPYLWRP